MTVAVQTNDQKGMLAIDITGVASTDNGGIGAVYNPEGCDLVILRTYLHARTGSTGAVNLDVGIGATSATKATDILSTFDGIEATIGGKVFYCQAVPVNETEEAVIWEDDEYLTFTGSATSVGLDATLYVEYLRLDA
jgi:hypothetical protein